MNTQFCARAGEPLNLGDLKGRHIWCRDCREVDPDVYTSLTGRTVKPASARVDVDEAIRLLSAGLSKAEIARRFGVAASSVGRALAKAGL